MTLHLFAPLATKMLNSDLYSQGWEYLGPNWIVDYLKAVVHNSNHMQAKIFLEQSCGPNLMYLY